MPITYQPSLGGIDNGEAIAVLAGDAISYYASNKIRNANVAHNDIYSAVYGFPRAMTGNELSLLLMISLMYSPLYHLHEVFKYFLAPSGSAVA